MDAFYASVEARDDPRLRGRPLIVGGSPNSRGVVCSASYEARKFGVRSAMPCAQAARLCPEGVFVRPNFEKYTAISREIRAVFLAYTPLVEPLSLDEAYLDVTNNAHGLYAVQIARRIQLEIFRETGLTGSAGVAPNKMLAKIASELRKPRGLAVILPEQIAEFMEKLPLRKVNGIGPATEKRLAAHGFSLCGDVWPFSVPELERRLGARMGSWLYARARGIDERPVQPDRERKSFGKERTFAIDVADPVTLRAELAQVAVHLAEGLARRRMAGRTVTLKVKYADFEIVTRRRTFPEPVAAAADLSDIAADLLAATTGTGRKVRLLGISLSGLTELAP